MSERTDYESQAYLDLISSMNELNEQFHLLGGYSIQTDLSQVLLGSVFKFLIFLD